MDNSPHCNKCNLRVNLSNYEEFVISNCNHIYCGTCLTTSEPNICYTCRSNCTTIALSDSDSIVIWNILQEYQDKKLQMRNKLAYAVIKKERIKRTIIKLKKSRKQLKEIVAAYNRLWRVFRILTGQGNVASTSRRATPTSSNPNRFTLNQYGCDMSNTSVSSNQGSAPVGTPSINQPPSSGTSGDHQDHVTPMNEPVASQVGSDPPNSQTSLDLGGNTRPVGHNRPPQVLSAWTRRRLRTKTGIKRPPKSKHF